MANRVAALGAKMIDPAYWCIAVVSGIAPLVVPVPAGYFVGGMVAVALATGLSLLERVDGRAPEDGEEAAELPAAARDRRPLPAGKVRLHIGRPLAGGTF
jgi:hypothetical protein